MNRLKKIKEGKGLTDLLIGQFLIAVLFYVAVAFYTSSPQATLVISSLLLIAIFYYSWRGMRQLWSKKKSKNK
ncbi:MAG: hypothetical protein ACE5GK_07765 [Nitrospiria bacterium]